MSIYVKNNNDFEQDKPIVRECPHCGVHAPMVPVSTPEFAALNEARPQHAGVAFRCAACNEPRFARAAIRSFDDDRVVLSANLVEVERPKEHFQYNYLPDSTARLLREAFGCYAADLMLAFAILSRQAIGSVSADPASGEPEFETVFDDACRLTDLDDATRDALHRALFDRASDAELDDDQAAILVEIVKDMFQQRFVRREKLRRAIRMRRFFASESDPRITPLPTRDTR